MTNKPMLSVEQELIEQAIKAIEKHHSSVSWTIATELRALLDKPAAQHQGAPTPITNDMHRLMNAYRLGEFNDEGGSDTVEALSVASFDAVESHSHDTDSCMDVYCAALYEQAKPLIWLALKPKHQGEPVAWQYMTHPTWDKGEWPTEWMDCTKEAHDDYVRAPLVADWEYRTRKLYAEQPAPAAEPITDEQILEAMRPAITDADGGYVFNTAKQDVISAGRALLDAVAVPVSVVMPFKFEAVVRTSYSDGWNEALDEVARLNGVKP